MCQSAGYRRRCSKGCVSTNRLTTLPLFKARPWLVLLVACAMEGVEVKAGLTASSRLAIVKDAFEPKCRVKEAAWQWETRCREGKIYEAATRMLMAGLCSRCLTGVDAEPVGGEWNRLASAKTVLFRGCQGSQFLYIHNAPQASITSPRALTGRVQPIDVAIHGRHSINNPHLIKGLSSDLVNIVAQ
ncbi:hypothetical protein MRB53_040282 [Persea americana]|nr:hypothetical protein MRB53_040282 [Persea americana]